jgi:hypothetical protein
MLGGWLPRKDDTIDIWDQATGEEAPEISRVVWGQSLPKDGHNLEADCLIGE